MNISKLGKLTPDHVKTQPGVIPHTVGLMHAKWILVSCDSIMTWGRHETEAFSALLSLYEGIHRTPVNTPHKGQWRVALMFSLIWTEQSTDSPESKLPVLLSSEHK